MGCRAVLSQPLKFVDLLLLIKAAAFLVTKGLRFSLGGNLLFLS